MLSLIGSTTVPGSYITVMELTHMALLGTEPIGQPSLPYHRKHWKDNSCILLPHHPRTREPSERASSSICIVHGMERAQSSSTEHTFHAVPHIRVVSSEWTFIRPVKGSARPHCSPIVIDLQLLSQPDSYPSYRTVRMTIAEQCRHCSRHGVLVSQPSHP
jgi:hypothetical protein